MFVSRDALTHYVILKPTAKSIADQHQICKNSFCEGLLNHSQKTTTDQNTVAQLFLTNTPDIYTLREKKLHEHHFFFVKISQSKKEYRTKSKTCKNKLIRRKLFQFTSKYKIRSKNFPETATIENRSL